MRLAAGHRSVSHPPRDVRRGETWTLAQRRKNDAIYLAARVSLALLAHAPARLVRASTQALGFLTWALWKRGRDDARDNLRRALGDRAPSTRALFRGLASSLSDTLHVLHAKPGDPLPLTLCAADYDVLRAAVDQGRGVIFATAHLGAWEAIGPLLTRHGFAVGTIARRSYDPRFDRIYQELREGQGVKALYRGDPGFTKALVKSLRRGMVIGFTMDLAGRGVRTILAPWPDGRRPTPIGPAELALRTGAALLVGTPTADGTLRIEPLLASSGESADILTQRIAEVLAARIRAFPAGWPWMHRDREAIPDDSSVGSLPRFEQRR